MLLPEDVEKREVLCSITTAATTGFPYMDWRQAINVTAHLGLVRFALFLTMLDAAERQECYALLRKRLRSHQFVIPFVHARSDMLPDEYRMFVAEFGTERFNLHPIRRSPLPDCGLPQDLRDMIFIENVGKLIESDLEGYAGLCLDLSHLEITRRTFPDYYPVLLDVIRRYRIGANHVSAYVFTEGAEGRDDRHHYASLEEFSYLDNYPKEFYGRFVAIELTNPLSSQLAVQAMLKRRLDII